MINLIAAATEQWVIGKDNQLLWKIKGELKYFKDITMGHVVVMGRKTYLSIGKPLPGRTNIVLTRPESFKDPNKRLPILFDDPTGIRIMLSIEDVLDEFKNQDIFVIGGAEIFKQFMPYADRVYLTVVHKDYDGDAYFPQLDDTWEIVSDKFVEGEIPHSYRVLEKKRGE